MTLEISKRLCHRNYYSQTSVFFRSEEKWWGSYPRCWSPVGMNLSRRNLKSNRTSPPSEDSVTEPNSICIDWWAWFDADIIPVKTFVLRERRTRRKRRVWPIFIIIIIIIIIIITVLKTFLLRETRRKRRVWQIIIIIVIIINNFIIIVKTLSSS